MFNERDRDQRDDMGSARSCRRPTGDVVTERQLLLSLRERVARLVVEGKVHTRSDQAPDADLHVGAEIRELLTGAVDGTNRIFYSTRVPATDPTAIPILVLRGLTLSYGSGFIQAGRTWWLTEAPETTGFADAQPIAIYRCDPRASVAGYDPSVMWRRMSSRRTPRKPMATRPRTFKPIL